MTSIHPTYLKRAAPLPLRYMIVSYTLQPETGFEALIARPPHAPTIPTTYIHMEDPKQKTPLKITYIGPTYLHRAVPNPRVVSIVS